MRITQMFDNRDKLRSEWPGERISTLRQWKVDIGTVLGIAGKQIQ